MWTGAETKPIDPPEMADSVGNPTTHTHSGHDSSIDNAKQFTAEESSGDLRKIHGQESPLADECVEEVYDSGTNPNLKRYPDDIEEVDLATSEEGPRVLLTADQAWRRECTTHGAEVSTETGLPRRKNDISTWRGAQKFATCGFFH